MNWLFQLNSTQPVARAIGILALVCLAGLALIRFRCNKPIL